MADVASRTVSERPGRSVLVRVRPALALAGDPTFEIRAEPRPDEAGVAGAEDPEPIVRLAGGGGTVGHVEVVVRGWRFELEVEDANQAALRAKARRSTNDVASHGPVEVRAIIPGRVVSVDVGVGDRVEAGGHLLVLEAMKMQNELQAPAAGRIARVAASAGATVDRGDLLVVIERRPEPAAAGLGPAVTDSEPAEPAT